MRITGCALAVGPLLLLLTVAAPARAQYMYLDANGDGIHDATDQLRTDGPTTLDIWVNTATNRDGSQATCNVDGALPLTINSWSIVLHAVGGALEWGPLENVLPITSPRATFADPSDTTDPYIYHNGWGGYSIVEPGLHHLARLKVKIASGDPAVIIRPNNPAEPGDLTSFGTWCYALDLDNTYKLGYDWFDADGIGRLAANPGGPYRTLPGDPVRFDGTQTVNPDGGLLDFAWDFGDGGTGSGATPVHAYAAEGEYRVALTVTGGYGRDTGYTIVSVLPRTVPIARAGGPYSGRVGASVFFDGRGSTDPNGDPLTYHWNFGDTGGATGGYAYHTYYADGVYPVTLSVSDGALWDTDATTARIDPRAQRPPVAVAGGPYTGSAYTTIRFDGSGSSDPDGDLLRYHWFFGDGAESRLLFPHHAYSAQGEYEVILEVSDGALTASDVTSAMIRLPVESAPIARAGGPYRGTPRQPVRFDGSGSSDADGSPLGFLWYYGDGEKGTGRIVDHAYGRPGTYTATLTVSDGTGESSDRAEVTIAASARARAFTRREAGIALGSSEPYEVLLIEPVDGSFASSDVDLVSITLSCAGSGGGIRAVVPASIAGDSDRNGIEEVAAAFRRDDLNRLLGHVAKPTNVNLVVDGIIWGGGGYTADLVCPVVPAGGRFAPVVRPNPFNPQATVTFATTKDGRVSAHLFSMGGRLVRTVLRDTPMEAGSHVVSLDARGDQGEALPSGIYFLRILGPDGPVTTRIAVAK